MQKVSEVVDKITLNLNERIGGIDNYCIKKIQLINEINEKFKDTIDVGPNEFYNSIQELIKTININRLISADIKSEYLNPYIFFNSFRSVNLDSVLKRESLRLIADKIIENLCDELGLPKIKITYLDNKKKTMPWLAYKNESEKFTFINKYYELKDYIIQFKNKSEIFINI